ncbi:MAG: cytochrome c biogenesis protein CcdA [Candidatus Jorgensenbacteria bacterium]|nr:cytochrome c biogenesis protein CcdA [Candidatus Jorgensenbacteria bacterium]
MNKKLTIFVIAGIVLIGLTLFFRSGESAGFLFSLSGGGTWLLPLIIAAALVDSINPCAFSVLILTIAFLFSIGKLRSDALKIGGLYILGIFVAYTLIGLGILQTLHFFDIPHFVGKIGASLLIIAGVLNLINEFFPRFPLKLKIPDAAHHTMSRLLEKGSAPLVFLLGAFVGLCEFPCTGGPYLAALGLLHDQATYATGLSYLLLYNLIFVVPLVVILAIASNPALLEKVRVWQREKRSVMRWAGGAAMVALGGLMFLL